jgi:YHS domain-containing protein
MKLFKLIILVAILLPTLAYAGEPLNKTCPISGEDINPDITVNVGYDTIGLCCNGCVKGFKKWDREKQLKYIADQKSEQSTPKVTEEVTELAVQTPYLLDTCPISGKKLGSMGDTIVEVIDGREVRFCCDKCPPKFKADKTAQFKKLDVLMIKQQLPFYPTNTCVISGESLDFHGGVVNFIYGNRLFRTCCNDCKAEFLDEPAKYVPELDEEIIKVQKRKYPLTTCVIGKGDLKGMGGPDYMIVGNRLVQLCCAGCRGGVLKDPLGTFAIIDAAKK